MDTPALRAAREALRNVFCCRRSLDNSQPAPQWLEQVRTCAVTGQPENPDFPLAVCPLRGVLVDPRYMHGPCPPLPLPCLFRPALFG